MSVACSRRTSTRPGLDAARVGGQQLLEVGLDAVLDQSGVGAELVARVRQHLLDGDGERLALGLTTTHEPSASVNEHGGVIQLSGL